MKRTLFLLVAAAVLVLDVAAQTGEVAVRATGVAANYRAAVNEALVGALEQHDGVALDATERVQITHSDVSTSERVNGTLDDRAKLEMNDAITKDMQKWAKGRIAGYTVLSDQVVDGKCRVEVEVRFAGPHVVGRDPNALRRLAVSPFSVRSATFGWNGQAVQSVEWSVALANQLNERLTQTRKFTMLDRAFGHEVDAELARLGAANAAPGDVVRLNQKLGADYLVVGEVTFNDVLPPTVHPVTGQALPRAATAFAEVSYRVLLAPTGQLKWMDTVRLDAAAFPAADARTFISRTAEAAAAQICEGMMANILPFEVVKVADGTLVIGEGGKQLHVGERFTVCALGEEVRDTRTGEVIDALETPVATAEIVTVGAKLSYARVIEGDVAKIAVGARLRRVPVPAVPPPPPPLTTTVRPNGTGGVVTPF